jgi:hypothetical protein
VVTVGPVRGSKRIVHPGGLAVALVGFGITRFVVAGTVQSRAMLPFVVAVVPLVVGLAFTIYGVILAIGDLSAAYINTVVRWTFLGVSAMAAVLGLTALGAPGDVASGLAMLQGSQLLVSNTLLGGAVGGALTGDRAGRNRRHRNEIELQAELALIANGLLRHEVLNATAIIDGYASLFDEDAPRDSDVAAIRTATDRIETTVADVGEVGRPRDEDSFRAVALGPLLEEETDALEAHYPAATFSYTAPETDAQVLADQRLRLLVRKLLETVAARNEETSVTVEVTVEPYSVSLSVTADTGTAADIDASTEDDPAVGFDRRIVELLSDYYGGGLEIRSAASPAESPVSAALTLPRATGERTAAGRFGVASPGLGGAIGAGVVAGVVMGILSDALTGLLPIIGSLYGVSDPLVGWITHLFHSVVFALLFAGGYTHLREGRPNGTALTGGLFGAGWGVVLWLVAAGLIMPVWLRLVGVQATLPNLTAVGLFTHAVWGVVLGGGYVWLRRRLEASGRWDRLQEMAGQRVGRVLG